MNEQAALFTVLPRCTKRLEVCHEIACGRAASASGDRIQPPEGLGAGLLPIHTISSDWESLYRLATLGRVVLLDRCVAVWRQHDGNTTATAKWPQLLDNLRVWAPIAIAARAAGLSNWRAIWLRLCCEAHGLSAICVVVSHNGAGGVVSLLREAWSVFGTRLLVWGCYPPAVVRVAASLAGYYRWRHQAGKRKA